MFPDYLICLEDGKKLKMLKRHLSSAYGMTPAAYREKWGLPETYPMVAPNYSERRSTLAKKFGLGNKSEAFDDAYTTISKRTGRLGGRTLPNQREDQRSCRLINRANVSYVRSGL